MALAMMRRLELQDERIATMGAQIAAMSVELERVEREACDKVAALTAELRRLRVRR